MYIAISFIVYFILLSSVGIFFYFRTKNASEFILGNRSLNYWVAAISAHASDMSAWLFMGYPAYVFSYGLFEAWIAIGLTIGIWLSWQFVAVPLRIETEKYNCLTLTSYFEKRFADPTGFLRPLSGLAALVFFMFYIAAGLVGMGLMFEAVFGINYYVGILIGMCAAVVYTFIGGFLAVAWNDFFQGIFLLFVILIVPFYALHLIGGYNAVINAAQLKNVSLSLIPDYSLSTLGKILNAATWGLGYFGVPHVLISFMGIDNVKNMKYAQRVGITWQILSFFGATAIGLIGIAYFMQGIAHNELVFVLMVKDILHPLLAGFVLCAILAATISTLDTQILLSASVVSEDFYKKIIKKDASQDELLWVTRAALIAIALIAFFIASGKNKSVLLLVDYAWAGLGSSFGPLVLASLYSKRVNAYGAIGGILVGMIVSAVWPYLNTGIYQMIPAFSLSLITIFWVSKITER